MTDASSHLAWRVVLDQYPGWSPDTDVWARDNGDGTVDLVALDDALEALSPPDARGTWQRYLVGELSSVRDRERAIVRGRILREGNESSDAWKAWGFERLIVAPHPRDPLVRLKVYTRNAGSAWSAERRRAYAAMARDLVPYVERAMADGALDIDDLDHAAAVDDLGRCLADLAAAERAL